MLDYKTFMLLEVFEVVFFFFSDVWKHRKTWLMACPETEKKTKLAHICHKSPSKNSDHDHIRNIAATFQQKEGKRGAAKTTTTIKRFIQTINKLLAAETCNTNTWMLVRSRRPTRLQLWMEWIWTNVLLMYRNWSNWILWSVKMICI